MWGGSPSGNHLAVDANLCAAILRCLNFDQDGVREILSEFERDVNAAGAMECKKCMRDELNEYNKKKMARMKRTEFVQRWDRDKLADFAVKTTLAVDTVLNFDCDDDGNENLVLFGSQSESFLLDKSQRKKQILFGYSLLNLKKRHDIVKQILERCSRERTLLPIEKDFIHYLWNSLDNTPVDITQVIINNFGFVYEKPILKLCAAILKNENVEVTPEMAKYKKISELRHKIAAIFCDLYFLSGRNKKLLDLYDRWFQ